MAIVQRPDEALAPDMPASAIDNVAVDQVLPIKDIPDALMRLIEANVQGGATVPAQGDVPDWVALENRFAMEGVDMGSLDQLAKPSTYTCPECNGTLWELHDRRPRRFRCHTGHAYTERSLISFQSELVENSVWFAMRALQEKHMLLTRMAEEALAKQQLTAIFEPTAVKLVPMRFLVRFHCSAIHQKPEKLICELPARSDLIYCSK